MISPEMTPLDGQQNSRITDLLAVHLDALIAADDDANPSELIPSFEPYDVSAADALQVYDLLHLSSRLRETLTPVTPSEEFVNRLKNDLVSEPQLTLMLRWRKLPAHYRLAASLGGLTLTIGIALLTLRRLVDVLSILNRRHQPEPEKAMNSAT